MVTEGKGEGKKLMRVKETKYMVMEGDLSLDNEHRVIYR